MVSKKIFLAAIALLLCMCHTTKPWRHKYAEKPRYKVGLLIVATGRYIEFVEPLVKSAQKHFLTNHDVTYFVFTDKEPPQLHNIVKIEQHRLGWPYDTMMRYKMYYNAKDQLGQMDYLFACDADMLFVDTVGDEILGKRVATLHPGFIGKRGTYETCPISKAYIPSNDGRFYFAGGFNGGKTQQFLKLCKTVTDNIHIDLKKEIIAVWHDESHINRYYIDNPPTTILTPSSCYPESWDLPYRKRLLALDKNHEEMRK